MEKINLACFVFSWSAHLFQVLCCLHSSISVKRRIRLVSVSSAQFYLTLTYRLAAAGSQPWQHSTAQLNRLKKADARSEPDHHVLGQRPGWDEGDLGCLADVLLSKTHPWSPSSKLMLFSVGWESVTRNGWHWLMNNLIDCSIKVSDIFDLL